METAFGQLDDDIWVIFSKMYSLLKHNMWKYRSVFGQLYSINSCPFLNTLLWAADANSWLCAYQHVFWGDLKTLTAAYLVLPSFCAEPTPVCVWWGTNKGEGLSWSPADVRQSALLNSGMPGLPLTSGEKGFQPLHADWFYLSITSLKTENLWPVHLRNVLYKLYSATFPSQTFRFFNIQSCQNIPAAEVEYALHCIKLMD